MSLLTSFTSPGAPLRTDYLETIDGRMSSGVLSSGTLGTAGIYLTRALPHRVPSLTKLGARLGATVAGNIGFGYYVFDGTDFAAVGVTTVASASGTNAITEHTATAFAPRQTVNAFLAVGISDATITMLRMSGTADPVTKAKGAYFLTGATPASGSPMPATITGAVITNIVPWLYGLP